MGGSDAIEHAIRTLAASQHGLVTRAQLLGAGLGEDAVDHRLSSGRLVRVRRGVYALGHAELRREGELLAVVLAARAGAVLSHRSAARLWGLRPWGGSFVELTVPGHGGVVRRRGVRVHRSADLLDDEVASERGVPVTSVARTLLDLAAVVPAHHLRRAVERAEQAELFHLVAVRATLRAHPGRPGWRPLVVLLADMHGHGVTQTRSDLEALVLQLCLDHGLPRPHVNRYDGTRESDFRWPDRRSGRRRRRARHPARCRWQLTRACRGSDAIGRPLVPPRQGS